MKEWLGNSVYNPAKVEHRDSPFEIITICPCLDARDALSKHLYARLFSWLIGKINETLNNPYPSQEFYQIAEIGLLDIYGS